MADHTTKLINTINSNSTATSDEAVYAITHTNQKKIAEIVRKLKQHRKHRQHKAMAGRNTKELHCTEQSIRSLQRHSSALELQSPSVTTTMIAPHSSARRRLGMAWYGTATAWRGTERHGAARKGMERHVATRNGTAWYGTSGITATPWVYRSRNTFLGRPS